MFYIFLGLVEKGWVPSSFRSGRAASCVAPRFAPFLTFFNRLLPAFLSLRVCFAGSLSFQVLRYLTMEVSAVDAALAFISDRFSPEANHELDLLWTSPSPDFSFNDYLAQFRLASLPFDYRPWSAGHLSVFLKTLPLFLSSLVPLAFCAPRPSSGSERRFSPLPCLFGIEPPAVRHLLP